MKSEGFFVGVADEGISVGVRLQSEFFVYRTVDLVPSLNVLVVVPSRLST